MREQQLQYQPWCHFRGWVSCWKSGKQTSPGENQLFVKYQMLASDMHRLHRLVLYRSCLNYMIMCQEAEIYREVIIGCWGNKNLIRNWDIFEVFSVKDRPRPRDLRDHPKTGSYQMRDLHSGAPLPHLQYPQAGPKRAWAKGPKSQLPVCTWQVLAT